MIPMGLIAFAPTDCFHPFTLLQVLVVLEEMFDLLPGDLGKIATQHDGFVSLGKQQRRDRNHLFIAPSFVFHQQYAAGSDAQHSAGCDGAGVDYQNVTWVSDGSPSSDSCVE